MNYNGFDLDAGSDVLNQTERCEEAYHRLAMAIVRTAAKQRDKKFFYSDWFQMLMPKFDGPALWKQIEENYNECGNWCRCDENVYFNSL